MGFVESEIPCGWSIGVCDISLISHFTIQVLDEADRLLTATFTSDLTYLFKKLPHDRQTCLFTATLTLAIESLAVATPKPGKETPFIHRMQDV